MTEATFRERVLDYQALLHERRTPAPANGTALPPPAPPVVEYAGALFWATVTDVDHLAPDDRTTLARSLGLFLVPGAQADHLYPWDA